MAFEFLGGAGAGAVEGLNELVMRQLREQAMQQQMAEAERRFALEQQRLAQDATQHADRVKLDQAQLEEQSTGRRDRANRAGLEDMLKQREFMDADAAKADMASATANLPGHLKPIEGLIRIGAVRPQVEDFEDPKVREQRELKRIAAMKQPIGGTQFEKVETVDDAGNPVIKYLTPEEVRAQGGVRTSPKTTAKASGPATVEAILGEIETLSNKINTGGMGPGTTITGLMRRGAAASNLDNDVAEYESLVKGFIPMVARAVGHTGVLTQQDVDSVRALFPRPGDNAQLAKNKIARVRALMAAMQPAASHGDAPTQQNAPTDPLGIRRPK